MKKTLFLMAVIALVPMMAWAGMTAITDTELQDVQAQAGLTISMNMTQTMGTITYTDVGTLALTNVSMPAVSLTSVLIDVTAAGLEIDPGTGAIMSGDMVADIEINGVSAGNLEINGLAMATGKITIAAH